MAIVTRTGAMGLAAFSFDFDDVSLSLVAVRVNNQDTRTLNIETSKGTFSVAPGAVVSRNLTKPQQEVYTVSLVPLGDGTNKVVFNFPHRLYFS